MNDASITRAELNMVERFLAERLNTHRKHIDEIDDELAQLRERTDRDLAVIRQDVAITRQVVASNTDLLNKLLVGIIGTGTAVVAAAAAIIFFGS